jgi:ammonia channel protein AmtB
LDRIAVSQLNGADTAWVPAATALVLLWSSLVHVPVAHWVFFSDSGHGGWIVDRLHTLDLAGDTAGAINSAAAGLAPAVVLGPRRGRRKDPMRPHNLPLIGLLAGAAAIGILDPDHPGANGLLHGGGLAQLGRQAVAAGSVGAYSFVLTWLLGTVLDRTIGFRAQADQGISGPDLALHAETAYEVAPAGASSGRMVGSSD